MILDYGAGNLHSLAKALASCGAAVQLESDPQRLADADLMVLPGVGAFGSAAARLSPNLGVLRDAISSGVPCLGICLGMQLLFESSEEGAGSGLSVFAGRVSRLRAKRSPQIGWNRLEHASDPLLRGSGLETAYFANGFACRAEDAAIVSAWVRHEDDRFPAIVRRGNIAGTQFHPEKSSRPGLRFLAQLVEELTR
jgi:glutamine amidotransferase